MAAVTSEIVELTELEKQVVEIKCQHKDTILFVECGYRYRFFGEDAEVAARVLNISCRRDHSFLTASIPICRLRAHIKRFVSKGFKVGIVKQTESSALTSIGNSKYSPFQRKLTNIYTVTTLVGDEVDCVTGDTEYSRDDLVDSSYLMCLHEMPANKDGTVHIGIIMVELTSGTIMYDAFEDSRSRLQLDSRLSYVKPKEIIIPCTNLSKETLHTITNGPNVTRQSGNGLPRIVRTPSEWFDFSTSLIDLHEFYQAADQNVTSNFSAIEKVLSLPPVTVSCISATVKYLKEFQLDRVMHFVMEITQLVPKNCYVQYGKNTVRHLELFENVADAGAQGTIYNLLNQTQTKFGSRLLKDWILHPLTDVREIEKRLDIVTDIMFPENMKALKNIFCKHPDLEKWLTAIYNLRASPATFVAVIQSLTKIRDSLKVVQPKLYIRTKSASLQCLITQILEGLHDVEKHSEILNEEAAITSNNENLFRDTTMFPNLNNLQKELKSIVDTLNELKPRICRDLGVPEFEYTSVHGYEYLIQIPNKLVKHAPKDWTEISTTKEVVRFHSPEIAKLYKQYKVTKELLFAELDQTWKSVLSEFSKNYLRYKRTVLGIAYFDCLISLASVADTQNFCRPIWVENGPKLHFKNGWNPILAQSMINCYEPCVRNDTYLEGGNQRCMVITGPNMGGKSCYIKQVALITLMAHIGSYVPAESVSMSIIDGIYTRMGAADNISQGRSTFMLELEEVSDAMQNSTSSSLIIFDELGRGTSTHDGTAIACATIRHLITEICCLALFVTHYPPVTEYVDRFPQLAFNRHMDFYTYEGSDLEDGYLVFLYKLSEGVASSSFGINTAIMAGILPDIVKEADLKSKEMILKRENSKRIAKSFITLCDGLKNSF